MNWMDIVYEGAIIGTVSLQRGKYILFTSRDIIPMKHEPHEFSMLEFIENNKDRVLDNVRASYIGIIRETEYTATELLSRQAFNPIFRN